MDVLIAQRLAGLRAKKKMSRSALSRATVTDGFPGVPEATIKALEKEPGRVPEARILEALAKALGTEPRVFHEYPIALAREQAKEAADGARRGAEDRGIQLLEDTGRKQRGEARAKSPEAPGSVGYTS